MSTVQTWQTESSSLDDTLVLAAQIGSRLRGGEVIVLASDLGGGKTAFVRGLAKGMGSKDTVRSPSFTVSNQYQANKLTLYHFDFYRLEEAGILQDELAEILEDSAAVVAIEWADIVAASLQAPHITLRIQVTGEDSRALTFEYPEQYKYLFV